MHLWCFIGLSGYVQYSEPSPYLFSKCYSYSSLSVWSAKRLFRSSLSFSRRQGYQGARCRSHFSVLILLLLLSGDVESNPGPSGSPGVVRCICDSKVESGRMVECSSCRFWVHSKCIKLPSATAPETPFSCCYCIHSSVRGFRALSSFSSSLSSLLKRNSSAIDSAVCSLSQLSCSDEFPELHVSLSALKTSITALLEALHHLDSYPSSSCPSPLSLSHSQPPTSLPSTAPTSSTTSVVAPILSTTVSQPPNSQSSASNSNSTPFLARSRPPQKPPYPKPLYHPSGRQPRPQIRPAIPPAPRLPYLPAPPLLQPPHSYQSSLLQPSLLGPPPLYPPMMQPPYNYQTLGPTASAVALSPLPPPPRAFLPPHYPPTQVPPLYYPPFLPYCYPMQPPMYPNQYPLPGT